MALLSFGSRPVHGATATKLISESGKPKRLWDLKAHLDGDKEANSLE